MFEMDDSEEKLRQLGEKYALIDKQIDGVLDNATPEQWLKLAVISSVVPAEYIVEAIRQSVTVDEMFSNLAEQMYPGVGVE